MLVWSVGSFTTKHEDLALHKRNTDRISKIIAEFVFESDPNVALDVPAIYVMIRDVSWIIPCDNVYHIIKNEAARILNLYWRSKFNFDPWIPSISKQLQRIGSVYTNVVQALVPQMYTPFFGRGGEFRLCNEFQSLKNKLWSMPLWLTISISATNKPHRPFLWINRWI